MLKRYACTQCHRTKFWWNFWSYSWCYGEFRTYTTLCATCAQRFIDDKFRDAIETFLKSKGDIQR